MGNRIKDTSRKLARIVSTSPKLERIDGAVVAEALEAERIQTPVPGIVIPSESQFPERQATENRTG